MSSLIDDIKRDREAGTEDHWWRERIGDHLRDVGEYDTQDEVDKDRIFRLPRMEAALLAAEELAKAVEWYFATPRADMMPVASALAEFRKATGESA